MAFGTVEVDTLVTSTQTLTIDDIAKTTDISTSLADWDSVDNTGNNTTLTVNKRFLLDSSASAFTVKLPISTSVTGGEFVVLADANGTFSTNNVTVEGNGSNIVGDSADLELDVDRAVVRLIYSGDATTGWLVK